MTYIITLSMLLTATTAFAQSPSTASGSDPWGAWMGCWQVAEESVDDAARLLAALTGTSGMPTTAGGRVCVTPSPDGGATMTTLVNGKTVLTETIIVDGSARPLADPNCEGSQRAEWSQFGPRIYARSEVSCGGQPKRTISGFSAVVSGPLWLDVQLVEGQGRKSIRVRRYRRVAEARSGASTTQTLAAMPLGGKLSVPEIKEATTKLAPEALQAVVLELGTDGYDLNARRLIELDDAGVPDSVIDLMVALSFPKKFAVERATPTSGPGGYGGGGYGGNPWYGPDSFGGLDGWMYFAHPMYYSSYYSPFGYYNWGYYDNYYYGYPGVVIINPGGGVSTPGEGTGTGRVVDGLGYTRIRPNVPAPRTGDGSGWGGSSSGGSSGTNSGSSSGGSVSTGGYSGAGGGGDRVAVPRPPGGR